MSQTSTDLDLDADTLLRRLVAARPAPTSEVSVPSPPIFEPVTTPPGVARPLTLRELALGAAGACLGGVLVATSLAVVLAGVWAAFAGSEILFWNWSEPAPLPGVALIVIGLPVAVYVACTIWLCILFLPLLTFRMARGLLDHS
ncbi:MAG: hypothetical protein GY698_09555 [Actinomycetia bacterium]|nr:hypothetical protein [Actinomycetes bacterium]